MGKRKSINSPESNGNKLERRKVKKASLASFLKEPLLTLAISPLVNKVEVLIEEVNLRTADAAVADAAVDVAVVSMTVPNDSKRIGIATKIFVDKTSPKDTKPHVVVILTDIHK